MAWDPDFLSVMGSMITHVAQLNRDDYGKVIDSSGHTPNIPAHVSYTAKIQRGDAGETVTSSAQVQTPPPGLVINGVTIPTITDDDHIILSDGKERTILSVNLIGDEDGSIHHQELALL